MLRENVTFIVLLFMVLLKFHDLEIIELLSQNMTLSLYNSQLSNNIKNKYCNICCIELQANTVGKKCGAHTLCKYARKIGPACKGYIRVDLTIAEKQTLLDAHNTIRNDVALGKVTAGQPGPQPSASNMRALNWDDELAVIADRWASQCIYSNDICRDLERFPVGQNIARGSLATDRDVNLIQNWFHESSIFNNSYINSFTLPKTGERSYTRYTQMVWADTYLMGCARAMFQVSKGAQVSYTTHLICNYGPTGNIPNQEIYRIGTPCSECHEGTGCSSIYVGLCMTEFTEELYDYIVYDKNNTQVQNSGQYSQVICHQPINYVAAILFLLMSCR